MVTAGIFYPFTQKNMHWTWLVCGLWITTGIMVITAVTIVLYSCIMKWYKTRERDDELQNIQTLICSKLL